MSARERSIYHAVGFVALLCLAAAVAVGYRPRTGESFGYTPDPQGTARFLAELDHPTFGDAAPAAVREHTSRDTFLYRQVQRSHLAAYGEPWESWNQGPHGSCVSFAFALGSYCAQAVDWCEGELPDPPKTVATEPIYGGSRTAARLPPIAENRGGDGTYGGAAARWITGLANGTGGILYRQVYGSTDLREYSIPRSIQMGRYGVPADLAKIAHEHKALAVARVDTWDELCASIERGSPVVLCSTVGYGGRSTRDADGFLERGSPWAHAMLAWAVRHKANGSPRDGALIQNSWSAGWMKGPKWPGDQPDGSFWASRANVEAALAQGDSFAIGGVTGFAWRELDHGEWLDVPPEAGGD